MSTYRNFIGGKWIESSSTRTAQNINPANTDDVLGTIRQATREEARFAVEAAVSAFRGWRATPAPARGKIVAKAARLMEENKEELAQLLTHEEGKTIAESRGELQRSINVAEFCAGESRRMTGETIPSELPLNFAYTIKQPLGVTHATTPSGCLIVYAKFKGSSDGTVSPVMRRDSPAQNSATLIDRCNSPRDSAIVLPSSWVSS